MKADHGAFGSDKIVEGADGELSDIDMRKYGWKQNATIKAIRADQINLRTRLLSIEYDTQRALLLYEQIIGSISENGNDGSPDALQIRKRHDLPIFGNARAGSWYVPSNLTKHASDTCAFKSADGHYGHWAACPRRPNIHLLKALLKHGGAVIVDVTRSGKRIPDSLSKTVPIWCAVLTTLIRRPECDGDTEANCTACRSAMSDALHLHPSVPDSEQSIIEGRLSHFVAAWRAAGIHVHPIMREAIRRKRRGTMTQIRALWTQPSRHTWFGGVPLSDLDFTPVICMSASDAIVPGNRMLIEGQENTSYQVAGLNFPPRPSFPYVQGAGDDEETWARGLTPAVYWKYRHYLLRTTHEPEKVGTNFKEAHINQSDNDDVIRRVDELILKLTNSSDEHAISTVSPTAVWQSSVLVAQISGRHLSHVLDGLDKHSNVGIILLLLGGPETDIFRKRMDVADKVRNINDNNRIKHVAIANHKGKTEFKYAFARALGPCLSMLRECCVNRKERALILSSSENGDWAAGLAIAWLAWHCEFDSCYDSIENNEMVDRQGTDDGAVVEDGLGSALYRLSFLPRGGIPNVDKQEIHKTMMHFLATYPRYQISRSTLKQLNRFFSSPAPPSTLA